VHDERQVDTALSINDVAPSRAALVVRTVSPSTGAFGALVGA
jgi:hypothetical protein